MRLLMWGSDPERKEQNLMKYSMLMPSSLWSLAFELVCLAAVGELIERGVFI